MILGVDGPVVMLGPRVAALLARPLERLVADAHRRREPVDAEVLAAVADCERVRRLLVAQAVVRKRNHRNLISRNLEHSALVTRNSAPAKRPSGLTSRPRSSADWLVSAASGARSGRAGGSRWPSLSYTATARGSR